MTRETSDRGTGVFHAVRNDGGSDKVIQQTQTVSRHTENAVRKILTASCHTENAAEKIRTASCHTESAVRKIRTASCHTENAAEKILTASRHTESAVRKILTASCLMVSGHPNFCRFGAFDAALSARTTLLATQSGGTIIKDDAQQLFCTTVRQREDRVRDTFAKGSSAYAEFFPQLTEAYGEDAFGKAVEAIYLHLDESTG